MRDTAFVYVIGPQVGALKVGVASDVEKRLSALQVGHPEDLTIHYRVAVARRRAFEIERCAHRFMADYEIRGEWFSVRPEVAKGFIRAATVAVENGRGATRRGREKAPPLDAFAALWIGGAISDAQYEAGRVYRYVYEKVAGASPSPSLSAWRGDNGRAELVLDARDWLHELHMEIAQDVCPAAGDQLRAVAGERRNVQCRGGSRDKHLNWLCAALDITSSHAKRSPVHADVAA